MVAQEQLRLVEERPPVGAPYLGFSREHDEDRAAATFAARYGVKPQFVFDERGNLLVGPLPSTAAGWPR